MDVSPVSVNYSLSSGPVESSSNAGNVDIDRRRRRTSIAGRFYRPYPHAQIKIFQFYTLAENTSEVWSQAEVCNLIENSKFFDFTILVKFFQTPLHLRELKKYPKLKNHSTGNT
jgi:hypothetical protein